MASENDSQPTQIDPAQAGQLQNYAPCPTCGGYVDEDSIWLRYNRFYCSMECGKRARGEQSVDEERLMQAWDRAIEARRA